MQARARFFAFSPDLFVISDDQGKAAQINEAWRHVLGWTSDDVIGNSFIDFVHPDDVGPATRAGRRALLREAVVNLETRVRCRDGSYRVIEWTLCRLPGDRVNYALGRDITESKHAEERLRAILDSGPEALLVVSSEGVIEFANRVLCRLFGYEHATLEGQPIESLMPEEFRERHREVFADYMKAPTVRSMGRGAKFPAVREDGSRFLAQISLSPLHLSGGSLSILAAVQPFYENKAN
ncbi:MAG: PAS domain S-box protein [Planctomycetota bacterium]